MMGVLKPFTAVGRYLRQIIAELRKTVTPTGRRLIRWTLAVMVFVLLLMAMITGLDGGLGWLARTVFA